MFSSPTWYFSVVSDIQNLLLSVTVETIPMQEAFKDELYDFFEHALRTRNISLGQVVGGFDIERKPIDMVIIHHTSQRPGLSPSRLSAIELVRLYAPYFANPNSQGDKHLQGQPIFSGHVRDGRQVFWPYHWIIRRNGRAERLLDDREVGWHAGDWDVNCRSIAIAFDNDYEHDKPGASELETAARLISDHYGSVSVNRVLGHREVNSWTTCPSDLFLSSGGKGWKMDLLLHLTKCNSDRDLN